MLTNFLLNMIDARAFGCIRNLALLKITKGGRGYFGLLV